MRAMVLTQPAAGRLEACERELPVALPGELLVKILACGVCRTDLHIVDGELPASPGIDAAELPLVPGHEIVGLVAGIGDSVEGFVIGDRIGIPWLAYTCGQCAYCRNGRENLCPDARFTGYHSDGGYADFTVVDAGYSFKLPEGYSDADAAPLLCAGLIGHRAYRMAEEAQPLVGGEARRLGLYGFGAAAHIIAQVALHEGREVYAFTSPGDDEAQAFARSVGVTWAGGSDEPPPDPLDAAIIFAPVGRLIPEALSHVDARRRRRLRRHPHERRAVVSLSSALAGAHHPLRREPDAPGRPRLPRARREDSDQDVCRAIRSRRCEPRVDQPARRARSRRRRAGVNRITDDDRGRNGRARSARSRRKINAFSADSAFSAVNVSL